ncbi:Bug family tripartite tricarboxylate transporter substrate binding protein [Nonomuraea sp. M3C6]|uniref:Bug family tripartite tricarboxylate transporter substrate binding protein n=1 Tax=Nonomuraea marmarensis TaxID=3351344 RepID=A0ABW7AF12_9ACTN
MREKATLKRRVTSMITAALTAVALTACGAATGAEKAEDYPSKDMDWTIAFGPGGGNDIMARKLIDLLNKQQLYPRNIRVENREGGSGATGWGYLFSHRGDPYGISTTSGSFITTPLQASTGWTHKDFVPVGLLATDNALFVVNSTSKITSWQQWVQHAKTKGKVAVGGIGTVNVDFILHAILAERAGYQIDYVPFNDEGQLQTSLLSGALDAAMSNPAEIVGQVQAGKMTGLLFTGKQPLASLPAVPTGESLGYQDLPSMPRGLILAPDAPKYAQDWWIATIKKVVVSPEWKRYLATNQLTEDLRWGQDFQTYLQQTASELESVLREHGAIK